MQTNNRDFYIDTIRGLCVVSVVFIHTVFWSGAMYCPNWIRNVSLLLDVPLFFFLTGCTMAIYNKVNPLKQIYKLAIIFFLACLIYQICMLDFNLKQLLAPLLLSPISTPNIKLLAGSYWFVPVYAISLLFAKIIIDFLKKWAIYALLAFTPIFYLYLYLTGKSYENPAVLGGGSKASCQMFLFYLWLIILGYLTYNHKKKVFWILSAVFSFVLLIFLAINHGGIYLQTYKFPTQLPYCTASMISVSLAMVFKTKIKYNLLVPIGQKAIYFYLSQAISSSILYSIVRIIHLPWGLKLFICYIVNLIMAITIGLMISKLEPKVSSLFTLEGKV